MPEQNRPRRPSGPNMTASTRPNVRRGLGAPLGRRRPRRRVAPHGARSGGAPEAEPTGAGAPTPGTASTIRGSNKSECGIEFPVRALRVRCWPRSCVTRLGRSHNPCPDGNPLELPGWSRPGMLAATSAASLSTFMHFVQDHCFGHVQPNATFDNGPLARTDWSIARASAGYEPPTWVFCSARVTAAPELPWPWTIR